MNLRRNPLHGDLMPDEPAFLAPEHVPYPGLAVFEREEQRSAESHRDYMPDPKHTSFDAVDGPTWEDMRP